MTDIVERLAADLSVAEANLNIAKANLHSERIINERLRAALQQLVTDYQDVPDPTDADGQAVFEEARRALEPKP